MKFEAAWVEGALNDTSPYSTSELQIRLLSGVDLGTNPLVTVSVFEDAGISIYCGFPSSQIVSKGVMSTDIPIFYVNSSLNILRGRDTSIAKNYMPFGTYEGAGIGCGEWENCNQNGDCDYCFEKCICRKGFGNKALDSFYSGGGFDASCKSRICPVGTAVVDVATAA